MREGKKWLHLLLAGLLACTLALGGCSGDDGDDGAPGIPGPQGEPGPVTTTAESCNVCHGDGAFVAVADKHEAGSEYFATQDVTITDVDFTDATAPVVTFTVDGAAPTSVKVGLAKLMPGTGDEFVWQNYYNGEEVQGEDAPGYADVLPNTTLKATNSSCTPTSLGGGVYECTLPNPTAIISPAIVDWEPSLTHRVVVYYGGHGAAVGQAFMDVVPAGGAVVDTRNIATVDSCNECHGALAGHGGDRITVENCVTCHNPGTTDANSGISVDLPAMIHSIHAGKNLSQDYTIWGHNNGEHNYNEVTYPEHLNNCEKCHTSADAATPDGDNWKNVPTIAACGACHDDVDFATGAGHVGGERADNSQCVVCHTPNLIAGYHEVDSLKSPDKEGKPVSITPNFTANISLSAPANGTYYVAGEAPVVTVTTDIAGADYTSADFNQANLYVYGPRAKALPVLTTGSTTDPAYDPAAGTPAQSHKMLATSTDPQVQTDASGFKYQLLEIPADLEPGTYMVQVAIGHTSSRTTGSRDYKIDGWALETIQIGTATDEQKVAGDCTGCHNQEDWGSMYHRSYFGTDGCIACHDQSGNHADPISNRVHAVHAATEEGDLLGYDWSEITFPQETGFCVACHNSGNDNYITEPVGSWAAPCIGCHGDTSGTRDHMIQNGAHLGDH